MKKLLLYFTLFALLPSFFFAQAPDTLWTRWYGGAQYDLAHSVQQTFDGGYIVTGFTDIGNLDIYLVKTNADGDTLWTRTFGGASNENGFSVQQTFDGGYIVAGVTKSFGSGNWDAWLIKTNANGDTLWTRTYGGDSSDGAHSVQQISDSGYVAAGGTYSFGAGNGDIWLLKTDSSGDTIWTKTYGGIDYESGASVIQTLDEGFVIAGRTTSFGSGGFDVFLIKTDANGETIWTRTYGGTAYDDGCSVQQTTDGGYILVGVTWSFGTGNGDVYLIKTDESGDTSWTRTFGGMDYDKGYCVQQTAEGGYIIVGSTESFGAGWGDVYLIKTNSAGSILWDTTYGGVNSDGGFSIQQTLDNGYIIAGSTMSFGANQKDIYLIKTKPDTFGIVEEIITPVKRNDIGVTIMSGPLLLPEGKNCKVFDITGRVVAPERIKPGIYFIEVDGKIIRKVIKVR